MKRQCFIILLLMMCHQVFGQSIINEEPAGIHKQAFDFVLKELSSHLKDSIIIVSGHGISSIDDNSSPHRVINTNKNNIYWNKERHKLLKEHAGLIDKNLIKLDFRSVSVNQDSLRLPVFAYKIKYKNRRTHDMTRVGDAFWMLTFKYDCDSKGYKLVGVDRGIVL